MKVKFRCTINNGSVSGKQCYFCLPCELDVNEFISDLLVQISEMPEAFSRQIEAVSDGDVVKWVVDNSSAEQVCVYVCNGGAPIPPEVLSKLTQPFFSTKSSGTGLGLAITKRIVNAHGGKLSIESELVGGTRVSVKLPVAAY